MGAFRIHGTAGTRYSRKANPMAKAQPVTTIKASPLAVFYARALAEGNISRVETQKDGSIIVWNSREHRNTMRMKNGL